MEENVYLITGGPLQPHEWIKIKREMTAADEAWIQDHATTISGTKKNPQLQMTVGQVKLAALKRMILAWQRTKTVKGHDGSETEVAIELSERAIEDMPRRIASHVNGIIDQLNPEEEDDEDFLHAVAVMPQASGVALGFDRLVMLATGAGRIDDVVWTPVSVI